MHEANDVANGRADASILTMPVWRNCSAVDYEPRLFRRDALTVSPVLAGHQEPRLPVVEGAHRQSCSVQAVRVSSNRAAMRAERVGGGHGTFLVLESEERLHHGG